MRKSAKINSTKISHENHKLIERIISGAIKQAIKEHPNFTIGQLTSSISKRFVGSVCGLFYFVPKNENLGKQDDLVKLKAEIERLNTLSQSLIKQNQELLTKKRQQDLRVKECFQFLSSLSDKGNLEAKNALDNIRNIK